MKLSTLTAGFFYLAFAITAKLLYLSNKLITMAGKEKDIEKKIFNPHKSVIRARNRNRKVEKWSIEIPGRTIIWGSKMDRIAIIREGLPYESIEVISRKSNLTISQVLNLLDLPQTTYNKKKREKALLNGSDSEIILVLIELLDFGLKVFNAEKEKFHRWLKKPNLSLGGPPPQSFFDSVTGIQEVRSSLNRLEYGNLA